MAKLPLFNSIPKFALVMPTGSQTQEAFFAQPFAQLFTKVSGFDLPSYLVKLGKITQEMANEYPCETKFDLLDEFLYNPKSIHTPFLDALAPYFDVRKMRDTYDLSLPRRFVSIADINEAVSLINLLAHICLDESIADDQWVLIANNEIILSPEWPQRIEALLTNLIPYNRNLASYVTPAYREEITASFSQQQLNDLSRLKFIFLSIEGNKNLSHLDETQKDALKVYPSYSIRNDISSLTDNIESPYGIQELELSNVFNYHRSGMMLINKFALLTTVKLWAKNKIREINYGKIHNIVSSEASMIACYQKEISAKEVLDLELKDQYLQRDKYPADILEGADAAGKDYGKLVPLEQSVSFFKDSLHKIFNFTTMSVAYANPFLGIQAYANGSHELTDQDYVNIANQQGKAVVFNSHLDRYTAQGYDFVQPLRKYVLQGKSHLHKFSTFFAQRNTQGFIPVTTPKLEEWTQDQVEKAYFYFARFANGTHHLPNLTAAAQTLAQRRLIREILADPTIDESEWIVFAKDQTIFRPDWYKKLNQFMRWLTIRYPLAKIIIAGNENPDAGFNFIDDPDPQKRLELFTQQSIITPELSWTCRLDQDLEAIVASSFKYLSYSLVLVRKRALHERLSADDYLNARSFYLDRFADLINFNATNVIFTNPSLAIYHNQEQIHDLQLPQLQEDSSLGKKEAQDLTNLVNVSDMQEQGADLPWQSQEVYRQAVTAPQAIIEPQVYNQESGEIINPLERINTIQAQEQLDLTPFSSQQAQKIAQEQPLFFGQEKPIKEYFEQLEPSELENCYKSSPKLNPELHYLKAGALPDLVAKVKKYVINLPQSQDRLQAFMRQNNVEDFMVHQAVWGKDLSEEDINELFDREKYNERYHRTMHAGEYGCSLSHTQILRKALYDTELGIDDWILIIEDDTRLNPDWYQMLNKVLLYVEQELPNRVEIINGAQNQIPNFDLIAPKRFVGYHSIYSQLNNYHQITPELGITLINRDFPAGAGFYLIRKSLLVKNHQRICSKIDWVADDIAQYYTFRPEIFAYVNPQLGFDDRDLESILDHERIASINAEKIKLRSVAVTNPSAYVTRERLHVIQKTLSLEEINQKFPHFNVIKKEDYASLPRNEQEKLFDFAKFKQTYGREITPEELNLTLTHHKAWCYIRDLGVSDFTFHFIVEDDQTLAPDFLHQLNCISEYIDTRLDLDTLLIQTSNSKQEQNFELLEEKDYPQHGIHIGENPVYSINEQQTVAIINRKVSNGSGSYLMLKFTPSHMHLFLSEGKRYFLAEDYVFGMPFTKKSIAFAQPQVSIKP
ncbi:glycosyltransferase family 25 protein [Psittacicella gerlachiana]|uniref:Glycosyl transferase family 25 domain-containing protein n=1 Tax=Psittacicella gerlachiana TaxID=2028574 RepID=A0A3A1YG60_9GAMM|nr:glycosyltransferase family 25 protein [Psittacicella gerlachiana]RIY36436.1 hypothetical protein CKF59_02720 [Psittacicella gerlachiana]